MATSRAFEILVCSGLCAMGLVRLTPSMSVGLSERSLHGPFNREVSEDGKPPRTGPAFLRLNSIAYRLEMLLITIILLVVLFYWRLFVVRDLKPVNCGFLDHLSRLRLRSFLLASRCAGPRNASLEIWTLQFLLCASRLDSYFCVWSILSGATQWPLLGWAGHITADRSVGYYSEHPRRRVDSRQYFHSFSTICSV